MYSVNVGNIIKNFNLEVICDCTIMDSKNVDIIEVNRPGLQLAGYLGYFFPHRIQLLGKMEMSYLGSLTPKERYERIDKWIDKKMPCIVISRDQIVYEELMDLAKIYQVPLLRTNEMTSRFLAALISYLNVEIAERISIHGEFLEVHGEGILITGESGVGKSETALELVKRGHRLIADDVVEIRKVSDSTLLGTSPEIIRHFIELRGIGIVDVKSLYGVGSVKKIDSIDMVVNLEFWDENKKYDRMGVEQNYKEILGIDVPYYVIPVRPGRNLSIILEVAAMKSRQISMGYNAAKVLHDRIEKKFKGGNWSGFVIYRAAKGKIKDSQILINESMKKHTSFKTGGPCDVMVIAKSIRDIKEVLEISNKNNQNLIVLGNCSNIIVRDKGIRATVLKIAKGFDEITIDGCNICAKAGTLLSTLSKKAYEASLTGLEFAAGIPGTVGGGVSMNAGAYGGEIKDVLISTEYIDKNMKLREINNKEHEFDYRKSVFSNKDNIILRSCFKLKKGDKDIILKKMNELNKKRREKQPINLPSAGSVFKRPLGYFTGQLIEQCNLKGYNINGAVVSTLHSGFIVNNKEATSQDIIDLIAHIKETVYNKYKVELKTEVKIIGEE